MHRLNLTLILVCLHMLAHAQVWDAGNGFSCRQSNGKWEVINSKGKIIASGLDSVDLYYSKPLAEHLLVGKDNRWMFLHAQKGSYSPQFDSLHKRIAYMLEDLPPYSVPVWKSGKLHFVNLNTMKVSQAYDDIHCDNSGFIGLNPSVMLFLQKDNKIHYTDNTGNSKGCLDYIDTLQAYDMEAVCVKLNDHWNVFDGKKFLLKYWQPDSCFLYNSESGFAFVRNSGKRYMLSLYEGKVKPVLIGVISDGDESYDEMDDFIGEMGYPFLLKNTKYAFYDRLLNRVSDYYDQAKSFYNGLAFVCQNGKWGAIDTMNRTVIPFDYDECNTWLGEIIVKKDGYYGVISRANEIVIPFEYSAVHFSNVFKLFIAYKDGKAGLVRQGKTVLPFAYSKIYVFNSEYAAASSDGSRYGILRISSNEWVTPAEYKYVSYCDGKVAIVQTTDKPGMHLIDIHNNGRLTTRGYESINQPSGGLLTVSVYDTNNGLKYGFINIEGKEVIPPKYDFAGSFQSGKAMVSEGKKRFYIDPTGTITGNPW